MTITETTPAPSGLHDMTVEELADLYHGTDDPLIWAAVKRDLARRDREDRLAATRAKLAAIHAEGERQAYAQYRDADRACCGELLSRAGKAAHARGEFADETALWRMPWDKAQIYGSEELGLYWLHVAPRVTARDYVKQQAADKRGECAQARDNREAKDHEQDIHRVQRVGRPSELAGDEAGAFRRDETPAEAPQDRPGRTLGHSRHSRPVPGEPEAGAGTGRPGRPVQRDGVADVGIIGTAIAVDGALQRRQDAKQEQAAAVPSGAPAAYRPSGAAANEPRIPGDQLLDLLRDAWLGFFGRYPSPAALDAVTLWAAHTHMRDENGTLVFRATPRLYLLSSEPGSGKSHVLELLMRVVPACHGLDLEPTKAGLVHTLNKERATVLLDEGDLMFAAGQRHSDVRAVLNGGTYRHGTVLNGKGAKANREPVFGAVALAGLDVLETGTGDTLNALMSRGVKIRMEKASGDNRPPKLTRQAEDGADKAKMWLERWAAQVRDEVAAAEPEIPEGIEGRTEDIWTPLLSVADAAGGTWPDRARAACIELALGKPDGGENLEDEFAEFAGSFATM